MALSRGIWIHQYLDDLLIRAQSLEEALYNTKVMMNLIESLGWIIKSRQVRAECSFLSVLIVNTEIMFDNLLWIPK